MGHSSGGLRGNQTCAIRECVMHASHHSQSERKPQKVLDFESRKENLRKENWTVHPELYKFLN